MTTQTQGMSKKKNKEVTRTPPDEFNKNIWAFAAVAFVLIMTSGQMWNHIRRAPLMHNTYIYRSSSGQFVIETYLVILINAGIAIGTVLMTDGLRSGEKADSRSKKLMTRIGFGMLVVFFSLLLSVFRQKSYGYPYRLTDVRTADVKQHPYITSVKNCFIRGSVVRYVELPKDEVDVELLQEASRREAAQQQQQQQQQPQ